MYSLCCLLLVLFHYYYSGRYIISVKDNKDATTVLDNPSTILALPAKRCGIRSGIEAVLGAVYGHISHNGMRNHFMTKFLDRNAPALPKYPYWRKAMRMVKVISDVVFEEVTCIIKDCSLELNGPFASLASDFYKDMHRNEDYGALTVSVIAEKYRLCCGREVYASKATMARLNEEQMAEFQGRSAIHGNKAHNKRDAATFLLDFVLFEKSKTAINCGQWIQEASEAKGVLPKYVHSKNVDGGALSAGRNYGEITREGRQNNIEINHCGFHCNNLASKEGLGVSSRQVNENVDLGRCIKKVHKLLTKMTRKTTFMKRYYSVQSAKGRSPIAIRTSCETRADGWIVEATVFNTARADIVQAYADTVGPNRANVKYLEDSDDEDDEDDDSRFLLSADEIEIIRQIECGYEPVVQLSKFTQGTYVMIFDWLFMIRHTCQEMSQPTFTMYEDISIDASVQNLRDRKRNVVVQTHSTYMTARRVGSVCMKKEVELARSVYVKNMQVRFGLTDESGDHLKIIRKTVLHGAMLNPLSGTSSCMLSLLTFLRLKYNSH